MDVSASDRASFFNDVKNTLILSHGNADVERGFSINELIVPDNRTLLSLASINGFRWIWDAIKYFGSDSRSSHLVPISIDMIRAAQKSKSIYDKEVSS